MDTFMKSKTGTLHIVGVTFTDGDIASKCQSYNLDRPNYLIGDVYSDHNGFDKVCKKCLTHIKK